MATKHTMKTQRIQPAVAGGQGEPETGMGKETRKQHYVDVHRVHKNTTAQGIGPDPDGKGAATRKTIQNIHKRDAY